MSVADDILTALARQPSGMTDADIAYALGKRHQHVNQVYNQLSARRVLRRIQQGASIVNLPAVAVEPGPGRTPAVASAPAPDRSWDWEGNVQAALCRRLTAMAWSLFQVADTASHQRGTDVVAERAEARLHLEVKGYPSTRYADPRRAHEIKPTQPTLQAKHWYGGALMSAIRLSERVTLRPLVRETRGALHQIRIEIFMVAEDGTVTEMTRGVGDHAA